MLSYDQIADLARPLLARAIEPASLTTIRVDGYAAEDGEASLQILAIADRVRPRTVRARAESAAEIPRVLESHGEPRFAYVSYVEPAWLEAEGDAA